MKSITKTRVIETIDELRSWHKGLKEPENSTSSEPKKALIGFVPTMGALHEGHMSLIRKAARECQHVVVSIFVNPMQFGPNEDFEKYPRTFEKDLQLCQEAGAEVIFHPSAKELYKGGTEASTKVVPPKELTDRLCGLFRPGHFTGVATVVLKLFSIVMPSRAYFGEKDFQQLSIILRMAADLDLPLSVIPVATMREPDGLALSSRNVYLSSEERKLAPELYRNLCLIRDESASGKTSLDLAIKAAGERLSKLPGFSLEYLEVCNPLTLKPLTTAQTPMVILIAGKLGNVRLIDNLIVN